MSAGPATLVLSKAPAEPPPAAPRSGDTGAPGGFDDALRNAQGAAGRDAAERSADADKTAEAPPGADAAASESTALPADSAPAPPATETPIVIHASLLAGAASAAPRLEARFLPAEAKGAHGLPAAQSATAAMPTDTGLSLAAASNLPGTLPPAQAAGPFAASPSTMATANREAPGEAAAALRELSHLLRRAAEPVATGIADRADSALPRAAESAESKVPGAVETVPAPARPAAGDTSVTASAMPRHESVAPPARLAIEAPVGTARFIDQAAQRVTWMARNGVEHAEIRVRPAELGPITVRIELTNNEVLVNFAVTQPDTRVAVEDALHRLEEMLAENGLAMSGANVGAQGFGSDGSASPGQAPADAGAEVPRGGSPADGTANARVLIAPHGLVDTFA